MKAWAAALAAETGTWPQIQSRVFFGFTALYREDKSFALLPRARALEPQNSIAFKLEFAGPRMMASSAILGSDSPRCTKRAGLHSR